jgi:hypothetical protein
VGIVAAIGLTLLVPVFSALNNSYVQNVKPPPWFPTPPTPPDITPPSDFKPPPDMTPPSNFHGRIPPQMCPPPVERVLYNDTSFTFSEQNTTTGFDAKLPFKVPNGTLAFGGWVNWTWQAASITTQMSGPLVWRITNQSSSSQGILFDPSPQDSELYYNSYDATNGQAAKAGSYVLELSANEPIQGSVNVKWGVVLACGGLAS